MESLATIIGFIFIAPIVLLFILVIIFMIPGAISAICMGIGVVLCIPIIVIHGLWKKIDLKFTISKYRKRLILMDKTERVIRNVENQIYWVKGNEVHDKLKQILKNLSKEEYELVKDHYSKFVGIVK